MHQSQYLKRTWFTNHCFSWEDGIWGWEGGVWGWEDGIWEWEDGVWGWEDGIWGWDGGIWGWEDGIWGERMGSEGDLRVRLEIRASGYRMSCYLVWLLYVLINYPNCLLTWPGFEVWKSCKVVVCLSVCLRELIPPSPCTQGCQDRGGQKLAIESLGGSHVHLTQWLKFQEGG